MNIRTATEQDRDRVKEIHMKAFGDDEKEIVSALAVNLLSEETRTLSLAAEINGDMVGHIAFSPARIKGNDRFQGYILAPLAVLPTHQKQGIGSKLIRAGLEKLTRAGVHTVFVYGDPKYYGRFGFNTDTAAPCIPPYKLEYPFGWQALDLDNRAAAPSGVLTCVGSLRDPDLW